MTVERVAAILTLLAMVGMVIILIGVVYFGLFRKKWNKARLTAFWGLVAMVPFTLFYLIPVLLPLPQGEPHVRDMQASDPQAIGHPQQLKLPPCFLDTSCKQT
jgi:hypothetical protein